jgi:transposase InsO family protein
MSDAGGEYKSAEFLDLLGEKGIEILQSVPHMPQQNGRAEQFNRTLMEKAEAMCHAACLLDSWWEFSLEHAVHVYNRTPMRRLQWKTSHKVLKGEVLDISHLCIFGCGAYVYLPEAICQNKQAPWSKLMVYLGS